MMTPDAIGTQPGLSTFIASSPDIVSGTLVFRETQVPLQTVFDHLADGLSLDDIPSACPTIDHDDASAVIVRSTPGQAHAI